MIRFQCPDCKTVMTAHDKHAGRIGRCPKCWIRLELPPPLPDSIPATPLPPRPKPASAESPPVAEPLRAPKPPPVDGVGPGSVLVHCPGCRRPITLRAHELTWTIECSRCRWRFVPLSDPPPPEPEPSEIPTAPVAVHCPDCFRTIILHPSELSLTIECSRCNCRFVPVPASDGGEPDPRPGPSNPKDAG